MSESQYDRAALLLHSLGMNHTSWDGVRTHLPSQIKVVTPDLPGHGDNRNRVFSLDAAVEECLRLVAPLTGLPLQVVGSGLGSLVALEVNRRLERSTSLLLAAFPPPTGSPAKQRADQAAQAISAQGMSAFAENYLAKTTEGGDIATSLLPVMGSMSGGALVAALLAVSEWRVEDVHPTNGPAMVVRGSRDVRVTEAAATALAHALGASLKHLQGGHLAYIEQAQAFAELVSAQA